MKSELVFYTLATLYGLFKSDKHEKDDKMNMKWWWERGISNFEDHKKMGKVGRKIYPMWCSSWRSTKGSFTCKKRDTLNKRWLTMVSGQDFRIIDLKTPADEGHPIHPPRVHTLSHWQNQNLKTFSRLLRQTRLCCGPIQLPDPNIWRKIKSKRNTYRK